PSCIKERLIEACGHLQENVPTGKIWILTRSSGVVCDIHRTHVNIGTAAPYGVWVKNYKSYMGILSFLVFY
ncbi:MAG: hypothetical protein KHX42_05255, partial [Prevotella sp.]|nr:hypothetical protein [Prevotella sp.]